MIFVEHNELKEGGISQVTLKGYLDSETAPDFENFILTLLEKGRKFLWVNAEKLEYCSSAGLGLILYLQKKISSTGGMMVIQGMSEELKTLFSILGFDRLVSLAETAEEAGSILEKQIQFTERPVEKETTEPVAELPVDEGRNFEVIRDGEEHGYEGAVRKELPASASETHSEVSEPLHAQGRTDDSEFDVPLIVECAECKSFTRVVKSGNYICPECNTEFTVEKDETIIF
jgi:anti-anti-sigma factor